MLEILPDEPVKAGEIVANRYRLDRIVGEGGMGVVWAATHVLTEKPCALKFLKANRASDPRSHSRLLHEARATCRVRHPNVAPVHDILELPNGVPFIVMDLLDGEPLSALLRRAGSLDWNTTLDILAPTTDAIIAAHEQGVVHRDLKPDNVFLERTSRGGYEIKVLDFGIAKRFDLAHVDRADEPAPPVVTASHGLTTTNSAVGTPSYMAPEQIRHDADVGKAADVWMLGMLAYECLTGERPTRDATTHGIAKSIAETNLTERARLGAPAAALVMSMLELDPADRPALDHVRTEMRALGAAAPPRRKYGTVFFAVSAAILVLVGVSLVSRESPRAEAAAVTAHDSPAPIVTTPPTASATAATSTTSAVAVPIATAMSSAPSATISPDPVKKTARASHPAPSASTVEPAAPSSNIVIPSYERR